MQRGCTTAIHVVVEHGYFIVEFDEVDEVLRIKQRKTYEPGTPRERVYDASYWHPTHGWGNGNTRVKRIVQAARANLVFEINATP